MVTDLMFIAMVWNFLQHCWHRYFSFMLFTIWFIIYIKMTTQRSIYCLYGLTSIVPKKSVKNKKNVCKDSFHSNKMDLQLLWNLWVTREMCKEYIFPWIKIFSSENISMVPYHISHCLIYHALWCTLCSLHVQYLLKFCTGQPIQPRNILATIMLQPSWIQE